MVDATANNQLEQKEKSYSVQKLFICLDFFCEYVRMYICSRGTCLDKKGWKKKDDWSSKNVWWLQDV